MVLDVAPRIDDKMAARRFAGAVLMPFETLRAEVGKHRSSIGWSELFDLKRIFGVSVQALVCRCRDLGIFGNPLYRRLFNEFSRRGWCRPPYREPWTVHGEEPGRFERLCFRAPAEGANSRSTNLSGSWTSRPTWMRLSSAPDSRLMPSLVPARCIGAACMA